MEKQTSTFDARVKADGMAEQIFERIQELRQFKRANPSIRGAYSLNFGSILNAYREGDLTFEEATEACNRVKPSPNSLSMRLECNRAMCFANEILRICAGLPTVTALDISLGEENITIQPLLEKVEVEL